MEFMVVFSSNVRRGQRWRPHRAKIPRPETIGEEIASHALVGIRPRDPYYSPFSVIRELKQIENERLSSPERLLQLLPVKVSLDDEIVQWFPLLGQPNALKLTIARATAAQVLARDKNRMSTSRVNIADGAAP